jgi:hypothetical protein|tara:strand:- start:847 stop:1134 length:288 start_codon:yes stop_codon:yes gene_type:complete
MTYYTITQSSDYGDTKEFHGTKRVLLNKMRKLAFQKRVTARQGWKLERFGELPIESHQSRIVTMGGKDLYESGLKKLVDLLNGHGSQHFKIIQHT